MNITKMMCAFLATAVAYGALAPGTASADLFCSDDQLEEVVLLDSVFEDPDTHDWVPTEIAGTWSELTKDDFAEFGIIVVSVLHIHESGDFVVLGADDLDQPIVELVESQIDDLAEALADGDEAVTVILPGPEGGIVVVSASAVPSYDDIVTMGLCEV